MDTEASVKSKFYKNKFEINHENNYEFEVAGNKLLLSDPRSAEYHILENIANMIKFNTMRFSPTAKSVFATID